MSCKAKKVVTRANKIRKVARSPETHLHPVFDIKRARMIRAGYG